MYQNGACYIRVSTDDQTEYSPDAQLRALKDYAKKNNIILTKEHIYMDEGISGKRADKRPAFMQMIATAKTKPKPFDVVLVHKFDRFARSREDSVVYKSLLKKEADIKVVSITESIEDDKFAVILEAMLEAMAEYYSLNLAEEVKKGMIEKATRGGLQSAPSFGYEAKEGKLVIIPEQAKHVKFMFEQFANNKMGMRKLATYMNEVGVKSSRGNAFDNRSVDYILNNPVYIGKLRWTPTGSVKRNFNHPDSIVSNGEHEPIISMDLWEKAQEVIKRNKELYRPQTRPDYPVRSWLKGLVKCGNCGKLLNASKNGSFQCNGYSKGSCLPSASITIKRLEGIVLEEIKSTFEGELEICVVPKASEIDTSNEFEFLTDNLKKLDSREERIKIAFQDGIDTLGEYKDNKKILLEERQSTLEKLECLKQTLVGTNSEDESIYKRMKSVYALLTDDEISMDVKHKTVHFLINYVTYTKQKNLLEIEYK